MAGVVGAVKGLTGREATSTGKVDVPPGRYWPLGASMRTVVAGAGVVVAACETVATGAWPGIAAYGGVVAPAVVAEVCGSVTGVIGAVLAVMP